MSARRGKPIILNQETKRTSTSWFDMTDDVQDDDLMIKLKIQINELTPKAFHKIDDGMFLEVKPDIGKCDHEIRSSMLERSYIDKSEIIDALNYVKDFSDANETNRVRLLKWDKWYAKNQMSDFNNWESKIQHCIKALEFAENLSKVFKVLDVDSIFSSSFPSSSDITIMDDEMNIIFFDITSSVPSISKLSNLVEDGKKFLIDIDVKYFACVLGFTQESLKQSDNPETQHEMSLHKAVWGISTEQIIVKIQKFYRTLNDSSLQKLSKTLENIMLPAIERVIPKEGDNYNSLDELRPHTIWMYKELCSSLQTKITDEDHKDSITRLIDGRIPNPINIYECAASRLKRFGMSNRFIDDALMSVRCLSKPKGLVAHPPCSYSIKDSDVRRIAIDKDYFLWVNISMSELSSDYKDSGHKTFKFISNFEVHKMTKLEESVIDFDTDQNAGTYFPKDVVAYGRLVVNEYYKFIKDDEELNEREFLIKENLMNMPKDLSAYEFKYKIVRCETSRKFYQLLFNPSYTGDDNFKIFLSRRNKSENVGKYKTFVPLFNLMSKSEDLISESLLSFMPSPEEYLWQQINQTNRRNKIKDIILNKGAPCVSKSVNESNFLFGSTIFNLIDSLSIQAMAFTSFSGLRRPANSVVTLNSGDYAFYGIWYIPGTSPNFRTTWRKFYSFTEFRTNDLINSGTLFGRNGNFNEAKLKFGNPDFSEHPLYGSETNDAMNFYRLRAYKGNESRRDCRIVSLKSSKFHSVNRQQLEWELELMHKAVFKAHSLIELREDLYSDQDRFMKSKDPKDINMIAEEEITVNVMLMMINRQQHSVQSTAYRYLHQALGSRDFDPYQILDKIKMTTCKSWLEIYYAARMIVLYKSSLIIRLNNDLNTIRSNNREVFTVAPDLLLASNSAILNKASYIKPNVFNKDKQFRVESEAACVKAVWDQIDSLRDIKSSDLEAYRGMPNSTFNDLISCQNMTFDDFMSILDKNAKNIQNFTNRILDDKTSRSFVNNFFHELWALTNLKLDFGGVSARDCLVGRDIGELFTLKGSSIALKAENIGDNRAVRKVTAMSVLISRLMNKDPNINVAESLADDVDMRNTIDQYDLLLKLNSTPYVEEAEMLCQYSEKDAPGKDREITTLNIEWGVENLLLEKIAQKMSAKIPEDLITHSAKEDTIYKTVKRFESSIEADSNLEILYINQDKSKYGPNRKNQSMLLTAMVMCTDDITFDIFSFSLYKSSVRKVLYPHEIMRQVIDLKESTRNKVREQIQGKYKLTRENFGDKKFMEIGETAKIMGKILEQLQSGSIYGPRGSFWAYPVEGMPGQGISGTIGSIQHAAVARLASKIIQDKLAWNWQTYVTSDDSMTCITFPAKDSKIATNCVKNFITCFNHSCGLVENLGKFVSSSQGSEMNGFFLLNSEPIVSIWKFGLAYLTLETSGNIGEDLLRAISKANDLHRFGGSVFLSTVLAACVMCMVLDAYRMWSVFYGRSDSSRDAAQYVWTLPPELMGLPSIDPVSAIISPIGTRYSSVRSLIDSDENIDNYSRYIIENSLTASKYDQTAKMSDKLGNIIQERNITYHVDGEIVESKLMRLPPTVNGLIGSLNRRLNDIKVAREIGKLVVNFSGRSQLGKYTVSSIIHRLSESLDIPMKRGTQSRSIFDQYKEVAHSLDYKFLVVSDSSFFPSKMKGKKYSLNMLKNFMYEKSNMVEMRSRFLNRISVKAKFGKSIEHLANYLYSEMQKCKILSYFLWMTDMKKNNLEDDLVESSKDKGRGKATKRRLIKIYEFGNNLTIMTINPKAIKFEVAERYMGTSLNKNPDYRYIGLEDNDDNGLSVEDAMYQTDVTMERINALIPQPQLIYAETSKGPIDSKKNVIDWLMFNPRIGYVLNTTREMLKMCYNMENPNMAVYDSEDEDQLYQDALIQSIFVHDDQHAGAHHTNYEFNNVTKNLIRSRDTHTVFKCDFSLEDRKKIMMNLPKFKLDLKVFIENLNAIASPCWYGNQNYRVKFKTMRYSLGSSEDHCTVKLTTKSASDGVYTHYVILFRSNISGRLKEGSSEWRSIETAHSDGKWSKDLTPVALDSDIYRTIIIDQETVWDSVLLGGRMFFKDPKSRLIIPTLYWDIPLSKNNKSLVSMESISSTLKNMTRKVRKVDAESFNMKKPIQKMSREEVDHWESFISEKHHAFLKDPSKVTSRFVLASLDLMSSLFVDGETKGLMVVHGDGETNMDNSVKQDMSGKVFRANKFSDFINISRGYVNPLYVLMADLWKDILEKNLMNNKVLYDNMDVNTRYKSTYYSDATNDRIMTSLETVDSIQILRSRRGMFERTLIPFKEEMDLDLSLKEDFSDQKITDIFTKMMTFESNSRILDLNSPIIDQGASINETQMTSVESEMEINMDDLDPELRAIMMELESTSRAGESLLDV